jgi:hypothetical protein
MLDETHSDYSLLQNGAVNLFWRKEPFEKSLNELRKLGYTLISIRFESIESFLVQLSEGLRWHDQFGYAPWTGNLDALNDSLRDPPSFSPSGCLAICIEDFDKLVSADPNLLGSCSISWNISPATICSSVASWSL